MPKLRLLITALLLTSACDTAPAELQFREAVNAEFESVEYAGKIISDCITAEKPTTFSLEKGHIWPDKTQSYTLTIDSTAPLKQVACLLAVLEANQPGEQP